MNIIDAKETDYLLDKFKIWFMPIGWRPRDLEPYFNNGRIGYNKSEQTKFESTQMVKSKSYLISQVILGLLFVVFTINLALPLVYWHRILLSVGLFLMIISWGGILESKTWSSSLEVFRILFMAISLVYVLHASQISNYQNWSTIAICIVSALSIVYFSVVVAKRNQENRNYSIDS